MRSIFGFVLLLGACGDNLPGDEDLVGGFDDPADVDGVVAEDEQTATRTRPMLCGTREWGSMEFESRDVDLSVVNTPAGAAVFTTPRSGGAIKGLAIDGRGLVTGEESGTIIRDDHKFSSVSGAFVDERLVLASFGSDRVMFDMIRDDLGARVELGSIEGDTLTPFTSGRGSTRVTAVAGKSGVRTVTFDSDWKLATTEQLTTVETFALTATQYFDDALVAWSTADSCHVRRVGAAIESSRDFPCLGARIAVDEANLAGVLVYEADGNVMISDLRIGGESELANARLLAPDATSPRVTFDGSRFWISYLDLRADLVVGYLEGSRFVSMSLEGLTPENGTHELALVNQRPWVFDLGMQGIAARGLCVVADQ